MRISKLQVKPLKVLPPKICFAEICVFVEMRWVGTGQTGQFAQVICPGGQNRKDDVLETFTSLR